MFKTILNQIFPFSPIIYDRFRRLYIDLCERIAPTKRLQKLFVDRFGYQLDLNNPQTFNEKLQWLKLYWHNPQLPVLSDKYAVREYVASMGLQHTLNEIIAVYDKVEQIDISKLPDKFVLKATHGSGWNIICSDKQQLDWKSAKWKLRRWMRDNFYYHGYEWGYLGIKPMIICEKYIETPDGKPPKDYKIFCFDGKPKMLFVASDRFDHQTKFDFYTTDWVHIPVKNHYPNSTELLERPEKLDEMLDISRKLSQAFPHVRVDLYLESNRIIFGELTFGHFSGLHPFEPHKYDLEFGQLLKLPQPC